MRRILLQDMQNIRITASKTNIMFSYYIFLFLILSIHEKLKHKPNIESEEFRLPRSKNPPYVNLLT